jgi:hypothetical protein
MHETLDARRFASPMVQAMLPWRMPRQRLRCSTEVTLRVSSVLFTLTFVDVTVTLHIVGRGL